MDPISITLTIVGWLATPLMTRLVNSVCSNPSNPNILTKLNLLSSNLHDIGKFAENVRIVNWQYDVPTVRKLLRCFKDAIYDAEDAICNDNPDERQITEILDNLQLVTDGIKNFLKERQKIPTSRKTTYCMSSRLIRGRTSEINNLKIWLLSDQSTGSRKNFSLLSIIGTGGIGKTVLSQLVFDSLEVREKFEVMAWVSLCKDTTPDIKFTHDTPSFYHRIISFCQRIISFFQTNDRTDPLNEFQSILESRMKGKRFFMVLDDVWKLPISLDHLYSLFHLGKEGSKIIITTQLEGLANIIDSDCRINLDALDQKEYWELFKECTFGHNNLPSHHSVLETEGRNISQRFGCSPVAAVKVGHELKRSLNKERWNLISQNKFCIAHRKDDDIISILGLCYEQLPEDYKQCYLSCALFPRNYHFEKHELNLIWIGMGFLHFESCRTNYLDDFSKRSFFVNATNANSKYVFHHVLHELAEYISDGEFLRLEQEIRKGEHIEIPMHTRHVYISANNFVEASEALKKSSKLRSLVIVNDLSNLHEKKAFLESLKAVIKKLKFLRFLVLPLPPTDLSDTVGNLKYLRFLQFPKNQQKLLKLSKSMSDKYKLKLWDDSMYLLVSNDIGKLIKLYCSTANIIDV